MGEKVILRLALVQTILDKKWHLIKSRPSTLLIDAHEEVLRLAKVEQQEDYVDQLTWRTG